MARSAVGPTAGGLKPFLFEGRPADDKILYIPPSPSLFAVFHRQIVINRSLESRPIQSVSRQASIASVFTRTGPTRAQFADFLIPATLRSCDAAAHKALRAHHFRRAPFQVKKHFFPCIPVLTPETSGARVGDANGGEVGGHFSFKEGGTMIGVAEVHFELLPGIVLQHGHVPRS